MQGIYKITNLINGKVYIGQSINIERRFKEHKKTLNKKEGHNPYFQNAWNKYGENNFKFEILEEVKERKKLNISPSSVARYLSGENNPYKELSYKKVNPFIEKELIKLYFEENMPIKDISKQLNLTDTTIRNYINKYKYANTEIS